MSEILSERIPLELEGTPVSSIMIEEPFTCTQDCTISDVVRMLALGADSVMLGRAFVYALAAAGGAGVSNLLELIDTLSPQKIFIVSPIMHRQSEAWLRQEFPPTISEKFEFMVFATDTERTESGEVKPGIGGEVYPLLGLADQPARVGFMPKLVQELAALS